MTYEHPEDRRARRLAEIRALRGTPERLQQIADLEQSKKNEQNKKKPPRSRTSSRTSGPKTPDKQVKGGSSSSTGVPKTPENSSHIFNHPWPVWFRMRDFTFEYLCDCARQRRLTSYGELWDAINGEIGEDLGARWRQLPHLLGYVSEYALAEIGLIPTALVVSMEGDDEPGPGFFRIAAALGTLPEGDAPPDGIDWQMTDSQRAYWNQTVSDLYERFATS